MALEPLEVVVVELKSFFVSGQRIRAVCMPFSVFFPMLFFFFCRTIAISVVNTVTITIQPTKTIEMAVNVVKGIVPPAETVVTFCVSAELVDSSEGVGVVPIGASSFNTQLNYMMYSPK